MERYLLHLMKGAEIRTQDFLDSQEKNPAKLIYGGIRSEIVETKPTIYALTAAISVYVSKESRFYHDSILFDAINLAVDYIARKQRNDGSFDYPSCNFHSAPDTSFCFKRLIAAYRLLVKFDDHTAGMTMLQKKYLAVMHHALDAIAAGGFHTPNHRWGISAALLQGADLFKDEPAFAAKLKNRAARYLAEGIDGDDDGEYAERSTGNYNAVVNNAMIAMYEESGSEDFLEYVRRNLKMMLYYIDPDDTIFTQNSTRQDQGKQMYPDKYFYQYLYMAARDHDPVFDAAAHKIIKDNMERGDIAPDCYHIVLNHDEMLHYHFEHYGYLKEYRKYFRHAGVLRVMKKNYSYTVISGKSSFLYFKKGKMCIVLKIGEAYCDIRNFIPEKLEAGDSGAVLSGTAKGWYYLPFETPPATKDWWQMDQSSREKLYSSEIRTTLHIEEKEDGLAFRLRTEGLDGLPMRAEVCIPAGTVLDHEAFHLTAGAGEGLILRSGYLTMESEGTRMQLGEGFGEHEFKGHYSGEEVNTAGYTVYMNAYTPFEKTFAVKAL